MFHTCAGTVRPVIAQEGNPPLIPLQRLLDRYAARLAGVPARLDGRPVVAYVGADVPREVLTAAGFVPFRLSGRPAGNASGEQYCGPGIDPVAVAQLARLLDGDAAAAAGLVISADCEGSVRLFLYLREILRLQPHAGVPPHARVPRFTFLDLLHLPQRTSAVYDRVRLDALIGELGDWAGRPVDDDALRAAAAEEDRVRGLIRAVGERLRTGPGGPRLTGAEALGVIGASFVTAPQRWCAEVAELLDAAAGLPPRAGTRVFLTGCSHDRPDVYELIESLGAVVVGEDHDWGALAGERRVGPADGITDGIADDIRAALVRAYAYGAPASAGHAAAVRAGQTARLAAESRADLVVAWARRHDDAPPWDVPAQRAALAAAGIPLVAVPAQPYGVDPGDEVLSLLTAALRDPAPVLAEAR